MLKNIDGYYPILIDWCINISADIRLGDGSQLVSASYVHGDGD